MAHDFVTVDMRGLKAALVARAQAQRVGVSTLVRSAVARELSLTTWPGEPIPTPANTHTTANTVKLSVRLSPSEAAMLTDGARSAGLSRGAYIASHVAGIPARPDRLDHLAALTTSTAELATLSRNLHHLTTLLRQGSVRAAQEYRAMLDDVAGDVREHLQLASAALVELKPRPGGAAAARRVLPHEFGGTHVPSID